MAVDRVQPASALQALHIHGRHRRGRRTGGFGELADTIGKARRGAGEPQEVLARVAHAYRKFANENPALYYAMFTRATRLPFGVEDTPIQLSAGFTEMREVVASVAGGRDVDTLTEVVWAALHGLTTLGHNDRLRSGRETERIELLVAQFCDARS